MQVSRNIKKEIGHIKNALIDLKKIVYIYKKLVLLFENNQIITASCIMILMCRMTMNERFSMIGLTGLNKQGVSQEEKKFCVLEELGNKMQLGPGCTVSPSMGSVRPGSKSLEKFTIFSMKLIWDSLLEIILKLKLSVSNKNSYMLFCKSNTFFQLTSVLLNFFIIWEWIHLTQVRSHLNIGEISLRWDDFSPCKQFFWAVLPRQGCYLVKLWCVFIIIQSKKYNSSCRIK